MANRTYTDFPERKLEKPKTVEMGKDYAGKRGSDGAPSATNSKPPYKGESPTHMGTAGSPRIMDATVGSGKSTKYYSK